MKFLDLVAGSVIFSTAVDMTQALRDMTRDGWTVGLHMPPAPVDPHLDITIQPKPQPRRRHGT